jgi:hypothetical protein
MIRHALAPLLLCSMLSATLPAGVAVAQDSPAQAEGRAHFRRGVDFFKEGDFRAALIEFKRAYELAPNYKVLYNLAQTSLELQDYAAALRSFERYLSDGGKEIPAQRRAQVEGDLEKLRKRVARVEVTTNVPDAEIFVDDVSVGRTPLAAPLLVSAGRRKVSALKGGLTAMRVVDVVGGDSTSVSLEIVEPAPPPVAAPVPSPRTETPRPAPRPASESNRPVVLTPSPPPPAPEPPSNTAVWVGVTVTGAFAAGTVVTGLLALNAKKDFDASVGRYGVEEQEIENARNKTRSLALVTDVLGGLTLLAGGFTVVAAMSAGSAPKERAKAMRIDVTPAGVVARGTF